MKVSASLSGWLASRSPRERRVIATGALASVAITLIALVLVPAARRWDDRRSTIAAAGERVRRYEALLSDEPGLKQEMEQRRRAARAGRLVPGVTPAVAASNVQSLLQRYARESGVRLDRVDVVGEPETSSDGIAAIPLQLSAQGDIHGLVALLERVQHGDRLLLISDVTIGAGTLRADSVQILSFTIRLSGAWAPPLESPS